MAESSDIFSVEDIPGIPVEGEDIEPAAGRYAQRSTSRPSFEDVRFALAKGNIESIREVSALPESQTAVDLVSSATNEVRARIVLPKEAASRFDPRETYFVRDLSTGVQHSVLEAEYLVSRGKSVPAESVILAVGPLSRLRAPRFFPMGEPVLIANEIPLIRLHCPHERGCEATFKSTDSSERVVAFSVNVLGFGMGRGKKVTCTDAGTLKAKGICKELAAKAKVTAQSGEIRFGNRYRLSVLRVDVVDLDSKGIYIRDLRISPRSDHPCGESPSPKSVPSDYEEGFFDCTGSGSTSGNYNSTFSLESQVSYAATITIPASVLGAAVNLSFGTETTFSTGVEVGCTLAGGRRYEWFRHPVSRPLETFWRTPK